MSEGTQDKSRYWPFEEHEQTQTMDTKNDTPETDKAYLAVTSGMERFSFPEHARRIERERDAARRECGILRDELIRLSGAVDADDREIIATVLDETTDFATDKP